MKRRKFLSTGLVISGGIIASSVNATIINNSVNRKFLFEKEKEFFPFQKFQSGDMVWVSIPKECTSKAHFTTDCIAQIQYTSNSRYHKKCKEGESGWKYYSLIFEDGSSTAWYDESELSLIGSR